MITKAPRIGKQPSKIAPRIEFFLADDIRLELDGKVTAVGLYPDRNIVAIVLPDTPDPSINSPIAIDSISLLINVGNLEGEHEIEIEFVPASGVVDGKVSFVRKFLFPSLHTSANLVSRFRPLLIGSFGVKKLLVRIDEETHEFAFTVSRREQGTTPNPPVLVAPEVTLAESEEGSKPKTKPTRKRTATNRSK